MQPFRVGHGFDLHRLEPGRDLILGGQRFEHDLGCEAHSDGDVVYHAVTDAVLGGLGEPDIGQLYPDEDPRWRHCESKVFVAEATRRMHEAGYQIGNLDVTVILQRPRLSPQKSAIRTNLATLLSCPVTQVNVKGKTHEGVGSLGAGRAVACHALVLLVGKSAAP